ncbi:hypothetical protein MAJHIDBO_01382 [Propionibacterium freudenreichii subsp. shermanii]|nr:hypothetical protein MAJHIDBO_01382 [Propionibacterium freudenreichii subsp. shermanii]SPS09176.1 hypothetical protein MAJHIDBO_01382 [Propionibacterium freudenreichii subsp. shermanii]
MPVAAPWMRRPATSMPKPGASALTVAPTAKKARAVKTNWRVVNQRTSRLDSGNSMPTTNR